MIAIPLLGGFIFAFCVILLDDGANNAEQDKQTVQHRRDEERRALRQQELQERLSEAEIEKETRERTAKLSVEDREKVGAFTVQVHHIQAECNRNDWDSLKRDARQLQHDMEEKKYDKVMDISSDSKDFDLELQDLMAVTAQAIDQFVSDCGKKSAQEIDTAPALSGCYAESKYLSSNLGDLIEYLSTKRWHS